MHPAISYRPIVAAAVALAVLAAFAWSGTPAVAGTFVVADQQNGGTLVGFGTVDPGEPQAQTFTPSQSGTLPKVDLVLAGSVSVTVQIRRLASNGQPTGTVLATTTSTISNFDYQAITFTFTTPATLTAGTEYAINVSVPSNQSERAGIPLYRDSEYGGGTLWDFSGDFGWRALGYDMGFQTYVGVTDDTPPNTTITDPPAGTGFGVVIPWNSKSITFTFSAVDNPGGAGVASYECQLDSGAFEACTSPKSYSDLTEGIHIFKVHAIDGVGNVETSDSSSTRPFNVDTVPPDTTITAQPPNPSTSASASFSFSSSESTFDTFQCSLDGAAFATCTTPKSYTGLADGSHSFQVRAKDGVGNLDPTPASYTWTVQTNATPTTTGIQDVTVLEDAANTVINLRTFFADAEDGADALTYAIVGNTNPALFSSVSVNNMTDVLTLDYAANAHGSSTITIRATDSGGLFVDDEFSVTVTAVNDAPSFTKGQDQTVSAGAGAQSVPGWASASPGPANESGQTVTYQITANTNQALFATQPAISPDGTLTFTPVTTIASTQSATLTVVVQDDGGTTDGGVDTSPPQTFQITVTAPATTIASLSRADASPTKADSVHFTVTFAAPVSGLSASNFTLAPSGIMNASITSVSGSGTTWTVTVDTPSVSGSLRLDLTNATGVTPGVSNLPFTGEAYYIDLLAPRIRFNLHPDGQNGWSTFGSGDVTVTDDSTITALPCSSDTHDVSFGSINHSSSNTTQRLLAVSDDGIHVVTCSATDAAGNTSSAEATVKVDRTAPTLATCATGAAAQFPLGASGGVQVVTLTATDATSGLNASASTLSGTVDTTTAGTKSVLFTAVDNAGNSGTQTCSYVVLADTTPPDTTIGSPPASPTKQTSASFSFSANEADSTFACQLDSGAFEACTSPKSYSGLADGSHTFQVRATDAAGNTDATPASATWTVDTTAPVVTVPANPTAEATGAAGAVVSYSGASATDLNPASPAVTCTPASGSSFALGTTIVTCSATDTAGNTGSKSFTVTVADTAAPVLTVPAPLTAEATGPTGAAVTFSVSATDAVTAAPTITCTASGVTTGAVSSGATFKVGTTTVSCTAKDAATNTSAAKTFTVTVAGAATLVTDLLARVQALPVDPSTRNNLTSIVQNAQTAISRGNTASACDKLTSFVSQVSAQSGKSIVATTATSLIADATRIKAVLGCA